MAAISTKEGGINIGRTIPGLDSSKFLKLALGSVELECFMDLNHLLNKLWLDTFSAARTIEIGHVDPLVTLCDLLKDLEGYSHRDILGIVKCEPRSARDRWSR